MVVAEKPGRRRILIAAESVVGLGAAVIALAVLTLTRLRSLSTGRPPIAALTLSPSTGSRPTTPSFTPSETIAVNGIITSKLCCLSISATLKQDWDLLYRCSLRVLSKGLIVSTARIFRNAPTRHTGDLGWVAAPKAFLLFLALGSESDCNADPCWSNLAGAGGPCEPSCKNMHYGGYRYPLAQTSALLLCQVYVFVRDTSVAMYYFSSVVASSCSIISYLFDERFTTCLYLTTCSHSRDKSYHHLPGNTVLTWSIAHGAGYDITIRPIIVRVQLSDALLAQPARPC